MITLPMKAMTTAPMMDTIIPGTAIKEMESEPNGRSDARSASAFPSCSWQHKSIPQKRQTIETS